MRILSTLLLILFCQCIIAQDAEGPGAYLNYIGQQYEETAKAMMSYASAVNHGKGVRKVEKRRNELLLQVKESERTVRKMKPFNKDSRLRDSVASYFRICHIVLSEDYGKILNLEDIAEQSYDAMEAYLLAKELANQKLDAAQEQVVPVYEGFATDNKIRLINSESKLEQKMKSFGKVSDYHNKVFLLFFKSFKNEAYFLDAANRGDINAMEQTKNAILSDVNLDLPKIGAVVPFSGDATLKASCQQVLNFYKKEATTFFPQMIEFQLKKENFEKMQKAMDAKRSNKSQKELDEFNKAIDDYNAWVKKANTANDYCNSNRTKLLNSWNNSSENFLDNHSPKYR